MANVTIIPPSTQVQTVSATGGGQSQNPTSASLQPGSIVSGTITGRDGSGNFLLRTPTQGTLTLQSNTPLTYNSDVVVQIGATGNNTSARIISVNGQPFADYAAPDPEVPDTLSQSLQTQTGTESLPSAASAIRGTIVSAPTAEQVISNTQAGNDNTQPVSGTNVLMRVTAAPETTSKQQANSGAPVQQSPIAANTQSGVSAIQEHAQAQQLSEDTTPANVAKLVAPQPSNIQQNTPTPAPATQMQTPEEELANADQGGEQPAQSQPAVQNVPSNILYAAYTKQAATTPSTPASNTPASANVSNTPAAPAQAAQTAPTSTPTNNAITTQTAPTTTAPTPTTPNNTLQAQVVATNTNASTVTLQTPVGTITVKAEVSPANALLLPGANVSIELPADSAILGIVTSTALTQTFLSVSAAPLSELASTWQTLDDIINVVGSNNAPAATDLLSHLPQLGEDFISSTSAFISAMAQGNLRKLLGDDAVDSLKENGRLDLLDKLGGEVSELNNAFAPTQQADQQPAWQTLFLPFVYQEELQQARLYIKREPPKKGGKNAKSSHDMRFVMEVDLSELGPMQMDGLLRSKEKTMSFDLIIRSRNVFSPEDKTEINNIYNSASELTGFKGSLSFHVTYNFPVKPLDEILANASRVITA